MDASPDGWDGSDLRFFLEECDSIQAIQIMANVTGPWGMVTHKALERIRDDVGNLPVWVWALEGEKTSSKVCMHPVH